MLDARTLKAAASIMEAIEAVTQEANDNSFELFGSLDLRLDDEVVGSIEWIHGGGADDWTFRPAT